MRNKQTQDAAATAAQQTPATTVATMPEQAPEPEPNSATASELRIAELEAEVARLRGDLATRTEEATDAQHRAAVREREIARLIDFLGENFPAESAKLLADEEPAVTVAIRLLSRLTPVDLADLPQGADEEAVRFESVARAARAFIRTYAEFDGDPHACGDQYRVLEDQIEAFGRFLAGEDDADQAEPPAPPLPPHAAFLVFTEWARRRRISIRSGSIETPEANFRVVAGRVPNDPIRLIVATPKTLVLSLRDQLRQVDSALAKAASDVKVYLAELEAEEGAPANRSAAQEERLKTLQQLLTQAKVRRASLEAEAAALREKLLERTSIEISIPGDLSRLFVEVR